MSAADAATAGRLLGPAPAATLEAHLQAYGPPPFAADAGYGAGALISAVERSGLTGRGGAGFPAGPGCCAARPARW